MDYDTFRIVHPHGDGWAEFRSVEHHDSTAHDEERSWIKRGARIFKCSVCDDQIVVIPAGVELPEKR